MKESIWKFYVVGSCDGLLCLCFKENIIYLWNPCLRESKRLPSFGSGLGFDKKRDGISYVYGFGYNHSTDDYQVVAFFCIDLDHGDFFVMEFLTLRTNSWSRFQDYPDSCAPLFNYVGDNCVFVDGALHWLSYDFGAGYISKGDDTSMDLLIVALDLATHGSTDELKIGVLKGCLCVMIDNRDSGIIDLYMMKDYGVSWNKLASFNLEFGSSPYQFPLFVSKHVLLRKFFSVINLYNLKDCTFRYSCVSDFFTCIRDSTICIESLVSPNAGR